MKSIHLRLLIAFVIAFSLFLYCYPAHAENKDTRNAKAFETVTVDNMDSVPHDTLLIATGSRKGTYYKAITNYLTPILRQYKMKVVAVETKGSAENIRLIKSGRVDAAILQYDTLVSEGEGADVMLVERLYPETVHIVATKKSGIEDIGDFKAKHKIAIGRIGSGSMMTWQSFCTADENLAKVQTKMIGGTFAFSAMKAGKLDALIYVGGIRSKTIMRALSGDVRIVEIDTKKLRNINYGGDKVYDEVQLTRKTYGKVIKWSDIDTLSTAASLVVNTSWAENNPDKFDSLYDGASSIQNTLTNAMTHGFD
jgi:TRAP transporter TAXI family solute receptor